MQSHSRSHLRGTVPREVPIPKRKMVANEEQTGVVGMKVELVLMECEAAAGRRGWKWNATAPLQRQETSCAPCGPAFQPHSRRGVCHADICAPREGCGRPFPVKVGPAFAALGQAALGLQCLWIPAVVFCQRRLPSASNCLYFS